MDVLQISKSDCKVSAWSGGSTTELLIWPPESTYAKRDFAFRISSATVDIDESEFTCLPGVVRYITPLHGGFELEHQGLSSISLKPYDIDRFSGDEKTVCRGRAVDFNLMLRGCEGSLVCLRGEQELTSADSALCLFFPEGGNVWQANKLYTVDKNGLLAFFKAPAEKPFEFTLRAPVCLCARIANI